MEAPPPDERPSFRGRSFRASAPASEALPAAPGGDGGFVPMPPPAPPPGAPLPGEGPPATAERYNARLSRARSSNRLQMRSASSAKLEIDDTRDIDAPEGQASSSSNDAPGILPPGALRRVPQPKWTKQVRRGPHASAGSRPAAHDALVSLRPSRDGLVSCGCATRQRPRSPTPRSRPPRSPTPRSQRPALGEVLLDPRTPPPSCCSQVADAMEAEIDRADCKEMVRDITHAVLPTRQTVLGMGGRGMPASLAGLELRYQQQQAQDPEEDPVPGEVAAALDQRGFQMKPSSRLANVDEFSSSNEASPKKVARQPARSSQQGAGASGGSPGMGVGISSSRRGGGGGGGGGRAEEQEWDDSLAAASAGYGHADEEEDEDADSNRLAMQAAIAAERADIVEELLRGSAGKPVEPNGVLASGKTYLGLAASAGMYKVAAALLAHGADPNLVDRNGDSPLHVGVRAEHLSVVRLLVDSGAVSGVIDASGTTPLQLAGSDRMRQLLLAAGMGEPLPERGEGDGEEEGSEEEEAADESLLSRPSEAEGILTNAVSIHLLTLTLTLTLTHRRPRGSSPMP